MNKNKDNYRIIILYICNEKLKYFVLYCLKNNYKIINHIFLSSGIKWFIYFYKNNLIFLIEYLNYKKISY